MAPLPQEVLAKVVKGKLLLRTAVRWANCVNIPPTIMLARFRIPSFSATGVRVCLATKYPKSIDFHKFVLPDGALRYEICKNWQGHLIPLGVCTWRGNEICQTVLFHNGGQQTVTRFSLS